MYSNKENINILTRLLIDFGVKKAVVCPGSRNAPILHNLYSNGAIKCFSVTDERSAGFCALGMSLSSGEPIVVCVTSGSAVLNLAPAVAEAYYQNVPLIVLSADRPAQWIGQSDGQTIAQSHILEPHVRQSVHLKEPHTAEESWHCNRLVNEALLACSRNASAPVHINVEISEPLFDYTIETLPTQRLIRWHATDENIFLMEEIAKSFATASKPMIVIGQMAMATYEGLRSSVEQLENYAVVLREKLSDTATAPAQCFDEVIASLENNETYAPDFLLYVGGTIVSKRLKNFLRIAKPCRSVLVDEWGDVRDTFMTLTDLIQTTPKNALQVLAQQITNKAATNFAALWREKLKKAQRHALDFIPEYSQMMVVKRFHALYLNAGKNSFLVYGNSSALRLGNIYATNHLLVNRGVNGIEGTLSTAVGYSIDKQNAGKVYCVLGDLSFFYDQNALWNQRLGSNLVIVLLNNGGGGIFKQLPGFEQSPSCDEYVCANHQTTAKGVCEQHHIAYFAAHNAHELEAGLQQLFVDRNTSVLLEVFTNATIDAEMIKTYYQSFKQKSIDKKIT